jgi:hypothetical protein
MKDMKDMQDMKMRVPIRKGATGIQGTDERRGKALRLLAAAAAVALVSCAVASPFAGTAHAGYGGNPDTSVAIGHTLNKQTTTGDAEDSQASISSSKVPRAGGNAKTAIPDDAAALGTATWVMALACLAGFLFLGFLSIKRRKDAKRGKRGWYRLH